MPSYQPKTSEPVHSETEVQDGGSKKLIRDLLQRKYWMVSIDLKDAYLSVPISPQHRKFLRFPWKDSLFEFQCLPFGLTSAPRVFTKLLKPVMALLRQKGIRCIIFLDDMLVMAQSKEELEKQIQDICQLLEFRINWDESLLSPTQMIEYLGLQINSTSMAILLPQEKVRNIIQTCEAAMEQAKVSVRDLSRLIGRMTATTMVVLPAPLCYQNLQRLKNHAFARSLSFETEVTLDQPAKDELKWWIQELQKWNGRPVLPPNPDLILETDVSLLGWGATANGMNTAGLWSATERESHINHLE